MVKILPFRSFLLPGLLVIGVIVATGSLLPKIPAQEVASVRAPDGSTDAVLIRMDTSRGHNYKVCFKRPNGASLNSSSCREIAYLSGVGSVGVSQPVTLVWTGASQLEIRYVSAASVHIYTPAFVWGSTRPSSAMGRYGYALPIFTKAVPVGIDAHTISGEPH